MAFQRNFHVLYLPKPSAVSNNTAVCNELPDTYSVVILSSFIKFTNLNAGARIQPQIRLLNRHSIMMLLEISPGN